MHIERRRKALAVRGKDTGVKVVGIGLGKCGHGRSIGAVGKVQGGRC